MGLKWGIKTKYDVEYTFDYFLIFMTNLLMIATRIRDGPFDIRGGVICLEKVVFNGAKKENVFMKLEKKIVFFSFLYS